MLEGKLNVDVHREIQKAARDVGTIVIINPRRACAARVTALGAHAQRGLL